MLQELIYTSAPAGLKPGSQGFCTVACTSGMPQNVVKLLESISGYRHVFLPPDQNVAQNPVVCSHLLLNMGGVPWHILSRTADAGLDYTQRVNKISHHLVLDKAELQEAGPSAVLSQYPFLSTWNQKPVLLPANKKLPAMAAQPRVCEQWAKLTGDAGWGGILAETALTKRPVSIIFRPGINMLPLVDEALALLPPEVRWQVSFSTYCCNLPTGTGCHWKCLLIGSPEMSQSQLTPNTLVIDLTQALGPPPTGQLVEAARTGKLSGKQEIPIIPLAVQDTGPSPQVAPVSPPMVAPVGQAPVKPKSAKVKTKNSDDTASKGCFWLIILFFILITAGLIGGLLWISGKNISHQGDASAQDKTIKRLSEEIEGLNNQLATQKKQQEQLVNETAKWQDVKDDYVKSLNEKDTYINRVAGYFSIFPQVSLPPISINLKGDIPRKVGEQEPLGHLVFNFGGTLDRSWKIGDMLSVSVTCPDDAMDCQLARKPDAYPPGNVLRAGYPFGLYAQKEDNSGLLVAEFELVVTENGISVRGWNDETWNTLVEQELKNMYVAEKDASGFGNERLIEWYEANIADAKDFALDEAMLKKIGELGAGVFTGAHADVARLIELRQDYYDGNIVLQFLFGLKLDVLTDTVKNEKP